MLTLGALNGAPALAGEFDVLGEPAPTSTYFIDDANVLSKASRSEINKKLKLLEVCPDTYQHEHPGGWGWTLAPSVLQRISSGIYEKLKAGAWCLFDR